MGRWAYLDTDEERLPEGMRRVGYDARTQTYTYHDARGRAWEGVPGARYGRLQRTSREPRQAVTTSGPFRPDNSGDDDSEEGSDYEEDYDEEHVGRRKRFSMFLDQKAHQFTRWSSLRASRATAAAETGCTSDNSKATPPRGEGFCSRSDSGAGKPEGNMSVEKPELGEKDPEGKGQSVVHARGNGNFSLNVNEKPLPLLPTAARPRSGPQQRRRRRQRRRRPSLMSSIARGVTQMFSADSEYRRRRG